MNLKTIYSTSPARGWIPGAILAPVLCIIFAIATELPSTLFLERFGFQDAQGDYVGAQGLMALLLVAFITWVLYAAYLHAQSTAGWRGRKAGWLALAGYAAFWFNFVGVNLFITGLHSYAGV